MRNTNGGVVSEAIANSSCQVLAMRIRMDH